MNPKITRRDFLKTVGAGAIGVPLIRQSSQAGELGIGGVEKNAGKKRLRVAHITDIHYLPVEIIPELYTKALRDIHNLRPKVDVIFNTGDTIMDSLDVDKEGTLWQWDGFKEIMAAECRLPIYHCIGNHDVWGWVYQNTEPSIVNDPLFGKNMAIQQLSLPGRYYCFDLAGWHFIMLDSTHLSEVEEPLHPYIGKLDDEQFAWLEQELDSVTDKPICILSHIPLLCACEFYDGDNETPDYWKVPAAWMHIDSRRTRNLFLEHDNVKLCLSGHAHQQEELTYLKIKYLNDGAICGAWWDGSYLDFPPGYVVIDLYANGSCTSEFKTY